MNSDHITKNSVVVNSNTPHNKSDGIDIMKILEKPEYQEMFLEIYNTNMSSQPYGCYNLSKEIFEKIKSKLGNPKYSYIESIGKFKNTILKNNHAVNKLEVHRDNHEKIVIEDSFMFIVVNKLKLSLDNDDIPILSKYDNMQTVSVDEFQIGSCMLYCVTSSNNDVRYMYASVAINNGNSKNIFKDISKVLSLF